MSASLPSLASLLSAVRSAPALAAWCADMPDADLSEVVRTARTTKGAVWLATRAAGPQDDPTKQEGQADTAVRCLTKLAAAGHPGAVAALAAWQAAAAAALAALTDDLEGELAAQV